MEKHCEGHKSEGAYATLSTESSLHDESVNINIMPTRRAWMSYASSRLVNDPIIGQRAAELVNKPRKFRGAWERIRDQWIWVLLFLLSFSISTL